MRLGKLIVFFFLSFLTLAQEYPQDYFMFPIRPGEQNFLSGSMGELRSNHFHAGIDIKTGGVTGYKIHCAADGYIARIKISSYGYGQAIYVKHPNGMTTVYAHCESFSPKIEKYIKSQQYKLKRFSVDLYLTANHFPVKQGEIIAYSGNTGSSGGPHLHFEIRNRNEEALNPLLFGFKEIKDDIPPTFKKFFLKPANINSQINGTFEQKKFIPTYRGNSTYSYNGIIYIKGKAQLSVDVIDRLNGASNQNGVNTISVYLDSTEIFNYDNEEVSFVTKYYNQHIDYQSWCEGNGRSHKCFIDDGNYHSYYKSVDRGLISLKDSLIHVITVYSKDSYGNQSKLEFKVQLKDVDVRENSPEDFEYDVNNNFLICDINTDSCYNINLSNDLNQYSPSSIIQNPEFTRVLFDLRKGIPYKVTVDSSTYELPLQQMVPSGKKVSINEKRCSITFPNGALFDTLYLELTTKGDTFAIGNPNTPLNKKISVGLRLQNHYSDKLKWAVYNISNGGKDFEGGTWNDNSISFRTKYFGKYTVLKDTTAPKIRYQGFRKNTLSFKISDDLSGIYSFNGYLNGQWILFKYDHKRNLIWSIPGDEEVPLRGHFKLIVIDNVGNKNEYEIDL